MSYEKEVAELWKEWKKSTEKYEEAIEDGYDVDADMWANDVETIHRQIHLYEQAAKADEYEAKVKAFDEIMKVFENNFGAADSIAKLKVFTEVENAYIESGESNVKK